MVPLSRNRALAGSVPNPLAVEYYGLRASAGLLISDASQVSQQGQGWADGCVVAYWRMNFSGYERKRLSLTRSRLPVPE